MNSLSLIFTILTMTVTTITAPLAPAEEKSDQQIHQTNTGMIAPNFLVFLNLQHEPCLGTLIHKQWILTAAHCYLPFFHISIAALKEDHFQNKMGILVPTLTIRHPNFTMNSVEHDLMLIKVKNPIMLNDEIKLAVLPNSTDNRIGSKCTVSGWTWTWKKSFRIREIQKNLEVVWYSDDDCQLSLIREFPLQITENIFCAGSAPDDTLSCQEVAAAPILCQNQLQGILSWSDGCALTGDVSYYTKVSHYTDWILQVIHTN
ncbi:serine protease 58-like [Dasypus novemcinctus]|uniref:serine protease 58-like n=1 Tax=Dasypus novemcinctus TaxID=9361 RepID=UPI00265F0AC3|nr:serine protease 58-like [Dasypus novemcinctus]